MTKGPALETLKDNPHGDGGQARVATQTSKDRDYEAPLGDEGPIRDHCGLFGLIRLL